jgi:hypothetical protein
MLSGTKVFGSDGIPPKNFVEECCGGKKQKGPVVPVAPETLHTYLTLFI